MEELIFWVLVLFYSLGGLLTVVLTQLAASVSTGIVNRLDNLASYLVFFLVWPLILFTFLFTLDGRKYFVLKDNIGYEVRRVLSELEVKKSEKQFWKLFVNYYSDGKIKQWAQMADKDVLEREEVRIRDIVALREPGKNIFVQLNDELGQNINVLASNIEKISLEKSN